MSSDHKTGVLAVSWRHIGMVEKFLDIVLVLLVLLALGSDSNKVIVVVE